MEKQYNRKFLYKTWYFNQNNEIKEVYFEEKQTAQDFIKFLELSGTHCGLNKWLWEVLIEK